MLTGSANSSASQKNKVIKELPQFLEDYIAFHNHHTVAAAERSAGKDPQFLIWKCGYPEDTGCGGVGDRIKGIISAFYTAICSRRIFLIDWPANY